MSLGGFSWRSRPRAATAIKTVHAVAIRRGLFAGARIDGTAEALHWDAGVVVDRPHGVLPRPHRGVRIFGPFGGWNGGCWGSGDCGFRKHDRGRFKRSGRRIRVVDGVLQTEPDTDTKRAGGERELGEADAGGGGGQEEADRQHRVADDERGGGGNAGAKLEPRAHPFALSKARRKYFKIDISRERDSLMLWEIYETKQVTKKLRKAPPQVRVKYRAWVEVARNGGSANLRNFPGFHDESLSGDLRECRSSRLNIQYRVVYSEKQSAPGNHCSEGNAP